MTTLLERRDYAVAAVGIVLSVAAGFAVTTVPDKAAVIDLTTNLIPAMIMLVGIVFIYLGRRHYGGQIAAALSVVGIATALLMVSWIPHFVWHYTGMVSMLSVGPGFWLGFFHVLTAGAFVVYFYGFYLFYRAGKPDVEGPGVGTGADAPESGEHRHDA